MQGCQCKRERSYSWVTNYLPIGLIVADKGRTKTVAQLVEQHVVEERLLRQSARLNIVKHRGLC